MCATDGGQPDAQHYFASAELVGHERDSAVRSPVVRAGVAGIGDGSAWVSIRNRDEITIPKGQDGALYSSAWSVAGLFLGIPEAGQVVKVSPSAFRRV